MLNEIVLIAFYIIILLYSVIIHEVFHGVAALWLGDTTAKYAGRLTFNPLKHIDPVGTIIVPLLMFFTLRFAFGWAKPVPYNPYNLKNQKWGPAMVALAGPGINIFIATIAAVVAKLLNISSNVKWGIIYRYDEFGQITYNFNNWSNVADRISHSFSNITFELCILVIFWNVLLAFFNLIPVPPLDGSKILFSILSLKTETMIMLEQFGFLLLLLVIFVFSGPIGFILNLAWNLFFSIAI